MHSYTYSLLHTQNAPPQRKVPHTRQSTGVTGRDEQEAHSALANFEHSASNESGKSINEHRTGSTGTAAAGAGVPDTIALSTSLPVGHATQEYSARRTDFASSTQLLPGAGASENNDIRYASRASNTEPVTMTGCRPAGILAGSSAGLPMASVRRAAATKPSSAEATSVCNDGN